MHIELRKCKKRLPIDSQIEEDNITEILEANAFGVSKKDAKKNSIIKVLELILDKNLYKFGVTSCNYLDRIKLKDRKFEINDHNTFI